MVGADCASTGRPPSWPSATRWPNGSWASDERAALLAGEILARGGQHPRLRVELQPLARELLQHVVGHHHRGLGDQAEAAELHRADHHLGRLPGADLVEEPDRRLGEHARDGGALVRSRLEAACQAGEAEPLALAAVVTQDDRVEPPVVLAGQPPGAIGVLPAPLLKRSCTLVPSLGRRRSRSG